MALEYLRTLGHPSTCLLPTNPRGALLQLPNLDQAGLLELEVGQLCRAMRDDG